MSKKLTRGNDFTRRASGPEEMSGSIVLASEDPVAQPVRRGLKSLRDLTGLIEPQALLSSLRADNRKLKYYPLEKPSHLGLTWDDEHHTYTGKFRGKEMPLSVSAVRTGCRFSQITPDWLIGKPPQRFIENIMDHATINGGVQIATDDEKILAFVEPHFFFMSDYDLLDGVFKSVMDKDVRGVEVTEHEDGDAIDYRIVFGKSVLKKDDVLTMLSLTTSQFGLYQSLAQLGLWRIKCLNGNLSDVKSHSCKWNHRSGEVKFMDRMGAMMQSVDDYVHRSTALLERARSTALSASASYIAHAMYEMELLKAQQYELVEAATGNREPQTAYDMWNILTDTAKVLPFHSKHRMERIASIYLSEVPEINRRALDLLSPMNDPIADAEPKKRRK